MTIILSILGIFSFFIFVSNIKKLWDQILNQYCIAEETWPFSWEIWIAGAIHAAAEVIIYAVLSSLRSLVILIDLPSVIRDSYMGVKGKVNRIF